MTSPVVIWEDNEAATKLTHAAIVTKGARHIIMAYHTVQQAHQARRVNVRHCSTDLQVADGFTKALADVKFRTFAPSSGMLLRARVRAYGLGALCAPAGSSIGR